MYGNVIVKLMILYKQYMLKGINICGYKVNMF
jgi:hypothetical protein